MGRRGSRGLSQAIGGCRNTGAEQNTSDITRKPGVSETWTLTTLGPRGVTKNVQYPGQEKGHSNIFYRPAPVKPGRGFSGVQLLSQDKRVTDLPDIKKEAHIEQSFYTENKPQHKFQNEKPGLDIKANLKVVTLNSQGRKLDECVKYMEERHVDILCIQESKIPSNSFFKYKDCICISSTDIKGGETKADQKITKAIPKDQEPPTATGTRRKYAPKEKGKNAVWGLTGPMPVISQPLPSLPPP